MSFPITVNHTACIQCGACQSACAYNALRMAEYPELDADNCRLCKSCIEACPAEALTYTEPSHKPEIPSGSFSGTWVLAEIQEGRLAPVVAELLGEAVRLGVSPVSAVLAGYECSRLADELFAAGADRVYVADDPAFAAPLENLHADLLSTLAREYRPEIILIGATRFGRGVSARTAALLNTGLTADCTELSVDASTGNLLQRRPAFGGNLLATIETPNHRPEMASVRPRVMKALVPDFSRKGEIIPCNREMFRIDSRVCLLANHLADTAEQITDAEILVAGGRGMQHEKNIGLLYELAELLGGTVAASRAAVETGWLPYERQVGQTGKTVSPRLYIACGISGQIQHTAALSGVQTLVAINNDPEAAIFQYADYGMVGDVAEILPRLIATLKQSRQEKQTTA